jgi:hypothetical protein
VIFSPVKGSESLQNLTLSCAPLTALLAKFLASPARLLALSPISEVLPTCSQKHSKVFQIGLKKPIRPKALTWKKKTKQNKTKTMNETCLKVDTSIPTFARG